MVAISRADYVPVHYVASRDDRSQGYFRNMLYSPYNHGRVVRDEKGEIIVHKEYESPLKAEIERLYFEAEALAGNTHKLSVYLARYIGRDEEAHKKSDPNDTHRLYQYLQYFSFKHHDKAILVKKLLERFIKENSLFAGEILK